ncbi:MAG: hypothetical protein ACRDC6_16475 [Shewanella sp.]
MALKKRVVDDLGRDVELYVRLNSAEISNHGVMGNFLFRGYTSKEAFIEGGRFLWEQSLEASVDVSRPIWSQAYEAVRSPGDVNC